MVRNHADILDFRLPISDWQWGKGVVEMIRETDRSINVRGQEIGAQRRDQPAQSETALHRSAATTGEAGVLKNTQTAKRTPPLSIGTGIHYADGSRTDERSTLKGWTDLVWEIDR
ncbi:MAG TPA: hypothetical protein VNL17_12660 [Verrucomicrobiae bacterium]|nr:hypothetical protein [Verrucomicrobiae bacterium]